MSQFPPPMPPQEQYPAAPPAPLPVQPIAYGTPSPTGRPGVLTAIGILSIVIGSFSILFNAGMAISSFGMMMAASATRTFATMTTPTTPAPAAPDPEAMTASERRAVMDGLGQLRPLSPARRRQLHAILVEGGRRMVLGSGASLTPEFVRGNVTDSGRLPEPDGSEGPDFFIMGRGRLELSDDHAVFYPLDGREPIRAAAEEGDDAGEMDDVEAGADGDPASATQPAGLTDRQVKAVIQHIQSLLSAQATTPKRQLTPAQIKTLSTRFSDPQSGFFSPAQNAAGARNQVSAAYGMPNGSVMIVTQLGNLQLDAKGVVTSSFTRSTLAAAGPMGFKVNEVAVLLSLVGALAGMALAVYLIVIGALALRQHRKAGKLHAIYAWLKIPLAIGCAIVWVMTWTSLYQNAGAMVGTPTGGWGVRMTIAVILLALLGMAYPIGLLLALRMRTVREYFNSVVPARADAWRS